jgi:HlyD family type I secretion membrane fusion protein
LRGSIAEAQQSIAGAMEIVNLGDARQAEVADELEDLRAQEADLADRIRAACDVRDRRQVVSPQEGVVTDLRLVTPGGVIGSGQPLMDIVPVDDELIIEVHIRPDDIDVVHPGLPAEVRLTAFKRMTAPTIEGRVTYVSADMLTDPRNGETYFLSRVTPSKQSLLKWRKQIMLTPGMPAEVMIATSERRAFEYFLAPLKERMARAFREE